MLVKGIALIGVVALLAGIPGYLFGQFEQNSDDQRTRQIIHWQFTASKLAIVFPVAFGGTRGLVFIDRTSGDKRMIYDREVIVSYPQLSADGERLLFARWPRDGGIHEMISCATATWRCRILLRTDAMIVSPIEVDKDIILYSSSPLMTRFDGQKRYSQHDFYLLEAASRPVRLSDFRLNVLDALNLSGRNLVFSAYGPRRENPVIPEPEALAKPNSEIFMLEFDISERRIQAPPQRLKPLPVTMVGDYSVKPSVSADGQWIAFLNQYRAAGRNPYHLAIGRLQGTVQLSIAPSGISFSRPAFVENTVLANELFDDRYEVSLFDSSNGSSQVIAVLDHSFRSLTNLERIEIVVEK